MNDPVRDFTTEKDDSAPWVGEMVITVCDWCDNGPIIDEDWRCCEVARAYEQMRWIAGAMWPCCDDCAAGSALAYALHWEWAQ